MSSIAICLDCLATALSERKNSQKKLSNDLIDLYRFGQKDLFDNFNLIKVYCSVSVQTLRGTTLRVEFQIISEFATNVFSDCKRKPNDKIKKMAHDGCYG